MHLMHPMQILFVCMRLSGVCMSVCTRLHVCTCMSYETFVISAAFEIRSWYVQLSNMYVGSLHTVASSCMLHCGIM